MTSPTNSETTPTPKGTSKANSGFIFVFVTVALDMLAMGLVIPVLPNLVNQMTGGDISEASKYIGLFSVGWATMQFIFMPIAGALSDQYGRKPIFLISNFGQALASLLSALSPGFVLLAISRLLSGLFSAVISAANAYIADTVEPDKRAEKFGLIGAAFGLGFILGPALGGYLGKIDLHLPFYVAAGLAFANGIYGLIFLEESLAPEDRTPFSWRKANPLGSLGFLVENPKVLLLSIIKGLSDFAFVVYPSIFVLYGLYRYGWQSDISGLSLGLVGILATLVQVLLVGRVIGALGEVRTMITGLLCCGIGFALYGLAPSAIWFWAAMPIAALTGFLNPAIMGLLSREVGPNQQGRLQGALGGVQAGTAIIGPLVFNPLFAWSIAPERDMPLPGSGYILAASCVLIACLLGVLGMRKLAQVPAAAHT
jgi:MFS transporter, DHA1 family, tetracycline resistance protein